jgi:hypothetical protein
LPYACTSANVSELKIQDGTEALRGACWPLLANLGAASANAYWMDMTVSHIPSRTNFCVQILCTDASDSWRTRAHTP